MNTDVFPNPTLRDLAYEIGQVQIYWCFLENEMRRQLEEAGLQGRLAKGAVITHWRAYMSEAAAGSARSWLIDYLTAVEKVSRARNLLAHGIQSVAANPWETDSAVVVCVGPDGSRHNLSIEAIRGLAAEIDSVRRSLRGVALV
ncbi:hypothetical protein LVY75_05195 (plasmid) [Sinorhizobium sp. B11]